jgi:hypothetical protein
LAAGEEDYFIIQDLLPANGDLVADLDHAQSLAEAKGKLAERNYNLVLFEYESSESAALEFVQLLRSQDKTIPFLFEYTDDATLGRCR